MASRDPFKSARQIGNEPRITVESLYNVSPQALGEIVSYLEGSGMQVPYKQITNPPTIPPAFSIGRGTSLPGSPADLDVFVYDTGTNNVHWQFQYDAGASMWNFIGGPPLHAVVETGETTSSTTYTTLATAGPSITVPLAGDYFVQVGSRIAHSSFSTLTAIYHSYDIGGTTLDTTAAVSSGSAGAGTAPYSVVGRLSLHTGLSASASIASEYRLDSGSPNVATFRQRWMTVLPCRVS